MAASLKTAFYNLLKYAPGDITSWLTTFNQNMDSIDTAMNQNKTAAQAAQDEVDNLEAEYETVTQTLATHTNQIDVNEKAIAANSASIEELKNEFNNIKITDMVRRDSGFTIATKMSEIFTLINSLSVKVIGNDAMIFLNCSCENASSFPSYDRIINNGIFNGKYFWDTFTIPGNPFNLDANHYYAKSCEGYWENSGQITAVGEYSFAVLYDTSSNKTIVGYVSSTTTNELKKMYIVG